MINKFFEELYYNNDILGLTGTNCFNYKKGCVDIKLLLEVIEKNNLKIKIEYEY